MVNYLRLGEKLKDLRKERDLKLVEVAENIIVDDVPISASTLQRLEDTEKTFNTGYKEIVALAKFYDVSADYLIGLTDNRKYRNVEIDELSISDDAIAVLKSKKLNNRLISELLSHPDFPPLLSAMEVYIDRKVLPQMNTMNAMYKLAESAIRENCDVTDDDKTLAVLQEAIVDEDEYLRYRISERFNIIMKKIFDSHKKDVMAEEKMETLREMKEGIQTYVSHKANPERGKMILFAKQLGLNLAQLSDEETSILMKALQRSDKYKRAKRHK